MTHDLFHQEVYRNMDFTIEADYTAMFPQYMVYDTRKGVLVGQTNACNFIGNRNKKYNRAGCTALS